MKVETAMKMAIKAMEHYRRRFSSGYHGYLQHKDRGWIILDFQERDHRNYTKWTKAIEIIQEQMTKL